MRVAIVDIGTNSTRLLIADVQGSAVSELERRTQVTRLGEGVDATGRLSEDAIARVCATLDVYREAIDAHGAEAAVAVLTSAVRDADNGLELTALVRERYGLDAHCIDGAHEAQLTFLGATAELAAHARGGAVAPVLVADIGGGSTELVVGAPGASDPLFHTSTQAGVVRQTERHLAHDPPDPHELQSLADEARTIFEQAVPTSARRTAATAIAVAGTPTSLAAIAQALDPYDPAQVHGYVLELGDCELLLARLAAMPLAERREVVGLHPDRAPTIVAGAVILIEVLRTFDLERVTVSEHDILRGAALHVAPGW